MSAVNVRRDCEAPGARPSRSTAGQAAFTKPRSAVSAFGAISVAMTSSPFARNSVAQLAPMTPVPMMATRRIGLFCDMSLLLRDFGVGDAGEVALCVEEISFTGSIEPCGVDRTREIGHEHAVVWNVEGDTDPLHEMGHHDLRLGWLVVDRGTVHRVAARWVAAVGPV